MEPLRPIGTSWSLCASGGPTWATDSRLLKGCRGRPEPFWLKRGPRHCLFVRGTRGDGCFCEGFLQDHLLASTAADAGNEVRQGAFAVCRRWNEVLKREPACWRHLRVHAVINTLIYRLLEFTRSAVTSHGRHRFQHVHCDGGKVMDAGIEALAKNCTSVIAIN